MYNEMTRTKKGTIAALTIAMSVVLPLLFHSIPNAGSIYSPMHIPVLLGGLVTGPVFGLIAGILSPIFSSMITGMPPVAYLPPMVVECAVYGLVAGLMMKIKIGKTSDDTFVSVIVAMLSGRVVAGLAKALIFARGSFTMELFFTSYFVTGLPGITIHIIVVPFLYAALEKARLIPVRY